MQLPAAHGSREVPEVLLQRLTSLSRPLSANALRSLGQHSAAAAGAPSLPAAAALIPPSLRSHLPVAPKRRYHHPSGEQGVRRRWQARWPFCGTGLVNTPIQLQRLASLHFPLPFSRSTPLQGRAVKMAAAATGHPPPSCGGGHPSPLLARGSLCRSVRQAHRHHLQQGMPSHCWRWTGTVTVQA